MTSTQTDTLTALTRLKLRMLEFPAALHAARLRADDAKSAHTSLREEFAQIEAETLLYVGGESTMDGKLKYSNEGARKAEATRRLGTHPLKTKVTEAESEARSAALDVQRAEDDWRAYRTVADLTIAEVDLLTA